MTYPLDKLGLINQGLALSGDNLCNIPEDGSDEWKVASAAYEAAYEYLLDEHDWKGLTRVVTLQPQPTAPADDTFTTAFLKPPDLIHLIWVRVDDFPAVYQILGNQIVINLQFANPGVVTAKYVSTVTSDLASGNLTRLFMTALLAFTRAGIYGGLHEDRAGEQAWMQVGEATLQKARTRSDQESPKRSFFNSRMSAARLISRPWRRTPPGWGGTGNPG